jgi:hypothetical protein
VPRGSGDGSFQNVAGTGTSVCSPTARISSNCRVRSYAGNTGTSAASGATRATSDSMRGPDSSVHAASKSRVSLDIPFAEVPCRPVITASVR